MERRWCMLHSICPTVGTKYSSLTKQIHYQIPRFLVLRIVQKLCVDVWWQVMKLTSLLGKLRSISSVRWSTPITFSQRVDPQNQCVVLPRGVTAISMVGAEQQERQVATFGSECTNSLWLESISFSIPGHQTYIRAKAFLRVIPECPSLSSTRTASRFLGEIITRAPHSRYPWYTDISALLRE